MDPPDKSVPNAAGRRTKKYWCSIRRLRLSLKYRPEILKLFLKMRQCIREKNVLLKKLKHQLKFAEQRKTLQHSTTKGDDNQDDSEDLTQFKKNHNPEPIESQRRLLPKSLVSENSDTDIEVILFDKGTSCDYSFKDSSCQTKTDNDLSKDPHVEKNYNLVLSDDKEKSVNIKHIASNSPTEDSRDGVPKEKLTTDNNVNISCTNTGKLNVKEAYTQTEVSIENIKENSSNNSDDGTLNLKNTFTQTDNIENCVEKPVVNDKLNKHAEDKLLDWTNTNNGDEEKSIAEQVKEVAQTAMQQSGMVYVESAGMYYDYKTGYYYNSELGLYYHTDTGCYYYYSDEQKTFVFHSYPDRSNEIQTRPAKPIRKSKINKKDEDNPEPSKPKRRKLTKHKKISKKIIESDINIIEKDNGIESIDEKKDIEKELKIENKDDNKSEQELEDGECSDSSIEKSDSDSDESDTSTATASDDESVAKHHPPCMRVIVRETNLPKLKVGSLFLVTKDGGTVGREGEHHAILLKDCNVSKTHLDIKFDSNKRIYTAIDLGSKNGTILNGVRMSESQEVSVPMEVLHGSTLQLGETKLLCHIHAGNDTCGHCEPGLIMEAEEKDKKVAYTRTCSVQIQHQLELARLKNKYAPQPLAILDTQYNDRAQARREKVGSSHHSEKTQSSDLDTAIASDNKGFKLLEKMGWSKGEGLGKESQGDTEPIPLISNEGKSGLGAAPTPAAPVSKSKIGPATLRLAARTKMLQPPAKAFQQPAEEDSE